MSTKNIELKAAIADFIIQTAKFEAELEDLFCKELQLNDFSAPFILKRIRSTLDRLSIIIDTAKARQRTKGYVDYIIEIKNRYTPLQNKRNEYAHFLSEEGIHDSPIVALFIEPSIVVKRRGAQISEISIEGVKINTELVASIYYEINYLNIDRSIINTIQEHDDLLYVRLRDVLNENPEH